MGEIIMNKLIKKFYKKIKLIYCKIFFPFFQKIGIHIVPNHFYYPIPDTNELKDEVFQKMYMGGIEFNETEQLDLLFKFLNFKNEYDSFPLAKPSSTNQFFVENDFFESVDCEVYYSMIRYYKPKNIIEIGSGFSTYLAAQAILQNKQEDSTYNCELIAIEPYPNDNLRRGFPGLSYLIDKKIQEIPLSFFNKLKENDILFIDSSHTLKIGSDVQYEILEILPSLSRGVIIHFHDIFLPKEYPKEWVLGDLRFWNEQYLFHAFMAFNNKFKVVWAGQYMHLKYPDKLKEAFKTYVVYQQNKKNWVGPGSFYIKRVAE